MWRCLRRAKSGVNKNITRIKNPLIFFFYFFISFSNSHKDHDICEILFNFFCEEFTRILKSYLWRLRTIYQLSIFIHACMRTFDFHNENDYQWSHLMFQSCRKKSVWVCMEVSKQTLNPGEIWGRVGTISKALWTVILTLPPLQQHQQKKTL